MNKLCQAYFGIYAFYEKKCPMLSGLSLAEMTSFTCDAPLMTAVSKPIAMVTVSLSNRRISESDVLSKTFTPRSNVA